MRGKPGLLVICLAVVAMVCAVDAGAQDAMRILRVASFGGDGLGPSEAAALQNLVTSYVIELKMFRVIDESGQELALKEAETAIQLGATKEIAPLTADYVLSGEADKVGTLIVFTMDVTKVTSGEKKSVADTFSSVNDVILASRRLTRNLFDKPQTASGTEVAGGGSELGGKAAAASPSLPTNAAPSLSLVAGTWKGDKNVDRVSILPDGRGFAVLASGVRMAVKVSVEGSVVVIAQDQPNSPDFYRSTGLDLKSARIVAAGARPWRWVFSLSSDGTSLSGVKESVFVNVDQKGAVSIDNAYVRDAVWTRLYR